jgi:hypothetical protein
MTLCQELLNEIVQFAHLVPTGLEIRSWPQVAIRLRPSKSMTPALRRSSPTRSEGAGLLLIGVSSGDVILNISSL